MGVNILFVGEYLFFEPLNVLGLASFLKSKGHNCEYLDIKLERNMEKKVKAFNPHIIGYSITTGKHKMFQKINAELKCKFDFLSIFGGPHCTFFPEFIHEEGVDIICRGEGEHALWELADCIGNNTDYQNIQNLWVKKKEHIIKNELRPLIENIDELPVPDRSLLDKYPSYRNKQQKFFMSGRGCPYKCSYCFNHVYNKLYKGNGSIIRKRSVDGIINEIKDVYEKYKMKRLMFYDDIFTIDKNWVFDFCNKYHEVNLPFAAALRVDITDEEIIRSLKKAGCERVLYGIESGNEYIRRKILNRNMSDEQIINFTQLLLKYKIYPAPFNIIGIPDETVENVFETIRLNIKAGVKFSYCSIYQPYPKTELSDYCISKAYFDGSTESIPKTNNLIGSAIKTPEIEHIVRLACFFSICLSFPFLIPLVKRIIKLPFNKLYIFIFIIYRGFINLFFMKDLTFFEVIKDIIATRKHPKNIYY